MDRDKPIEVSSLTCRFLGNNFQRKKVSSKITVNGREAKKERNQPNELNN